MRSAMPDRSRICPSRMKKGTATRMKDVEPVHATSPIITVRGRNE